LAAAAHFARMPVEVFGGSMPPVFTEVGTLYADRVGDVLDLWDEGERTLIHGDPHAGNLFDDGEQAGFFDWAMFSHSPGLRDVAYFLACSVPTEVRRAEEAGLLTRYRETLASLGVEVDAAEADRQYRMFAVFAWVSMATTAVMGSRWQTTDYGLAAMERATASVGDLGSVDLLRDLLG
jgi:thiamine kinase-like enzyme